MEKPSCGLQKELEEDNESSENTNAALALAAGDFIMLADHDDIVAKDAVES